MSHFLSTVGRCPLPRQLRIIRRPVPRSVLQSPVTSLVLTRLNYGNSTLAGIPLYLLKRLQSVMNSAARLVLALSRYDHVAPLLRQLHWLMARSESISSSLSLFTSVSTDQHLRTLPMNSASLRTDARRHLRSASSPLLIVRHMWLSTIGNRAFPVATVWNGLPHHITLAPSLAVFCSRLKTHLFRRCFP